MNLSRIKLEGLRMKHKSPRLRSERSFGFGQYFVARSLHTVSKEIFFHPSFNKLPCRLCKFIPILLKDFTNSCFPWKQSWRKIWHGKFTLKVVCSELFRLGLTFIEGIFWTLFNLSCASDLDSCSNVAGKIFLSPNTTFCFFSCSFIFFVINFSTVPSNRKQLEIIIWLKASRTPINWRQNVLFTQNNYKRLTLKLRSSFVR